ncbi:MAG: hypothetical protein P1P81_11140, partial [Desulfobulbales bacterium]|nr:hypothetical protein [Desulfobulbales bacterium]
PLVCTLFATLFGTDQHFSSGPAIRLATLLSQKKPLNYLWPVNNYWGIIDPSVLFLAKSHHQT